MLLYDYISSVSTYTPIYESRPRIHKIVYRSRRLTNEQDHRSVDDPVVGAQVGRLVGGWWVVE